MRDATNEKRVIKRYRRDVDGDWNKGRDSWKELRSGVLGEGECVKCVCVRRKDDGEQKIIIMHNCKRVGELWRKKNII